MTANVSWRLILKDWRLNGPAIVFCVAGGLAALGILLLGGQTAFVLGTVCFFMAMIFGASILPLSNIVGERKKKTLPFLMSLPISPVQYGTTKLVSTLGIFLVQWLTLVAAGLYLILERHALPMGTVPTALILATTPLIGFCLVTGIALAAESEKAAVAATAVVNSSYWLAWYLIASHVPALNRYWDGPVAVWNATAEAILGAEFAIIVAILLLTRLIQSQKHDFL